MVIDPQGSNLTAVPGAFSTADPSGRTWPDDDATATIRFVPASSFDLAAYGQLYETVHNRIVEGRWPGAAVLCDEAQTVMPSQGTDPRALGFVYSDTKLATLHLACSTRPRGVARVNLSNARYAAIFALPLVDDRTYMAAELGIPPAQLEAQMHALPEHGFLWWDMVTRTLQPSRLAL